MEELRKESGDLRSTFPVPPFWEGAVNLGQVASFYRAVLRLPKNVVFLGSNEVILFLQNFFREYIVNMDGDQSFYFCSDSDLALLERLIASLPPEETAGVILPRRVEEFKFLTLSFVFPWKKVFLGSVHGIVAEAARALFYPFFPVEDGYHYFWHRGALLYLPLLCLGIRVEELEQGFTEGYPLFQEEAMVMSLLLVHNEAVWKEVCFLVDNQFLLSLFQSFLPLLEKSCRGEKSISFRVRDFLSFWDTCGDWPSWKDSLASTFFVVVRSEGSKQDLLFQRPALLQKEFFFEEWNLLDRDSFYRFHQAEGSALLSLFQREGISWVELCCHQANLEMVGQMVAFVHQWACYNAWLRGLDLLSDPPISGFESMVKKFLRKDGKAWG
ncbi:MAG: hypothetical protein N2Z84_04160 [Atribacterota bacterium]|nr:hypothetical protein [Atribacterota bacterium]